MLINIVYKCFYKRNLKKYHIPTFYKILNKNLIYKNKYNY